MSFFPAARLLRRETMFGVFDGADLVAVATTSDPHGPTSPPELAMLREEVWRELGADARAVSMRPAPSWTSSSATGRTST